MNEEYWKQHMEQQKNLVGGTPAFYKRFLKFIYNFNRELMRLFHPGKCDKELNIEQPFFGENVFEFYEVEIPRLKNYFKNLFRFK